MKLSALLEGAKYPMFLDADVIMTVAMGIFVIALLGLAGYFGAKKLKGMRNVKGTGVKLRILGPGVEKELEIQVPPSGFYEYERGENDILPIYLDHQYARINRETGEKVYYACEQTGRCYNHVTPHPKTDEEAMKWLPNDKVKHILDGGLVAQFVKSWEPPWWEGLLKYLPWVIVVAALFALPQVIGGMKDALGFMILGAWL